MKVLRYAWRYKPCLHYTDLYNTSWKSDLCRQVPGLACICITELCDDSNKFWSKLTAYKYVVLITFVRSK